VDSATIDQLQDDIAKVARAYPTTPLLTSFSEARRVQKLAYEQIDHTGRPAQLNDLYLIAGEACGILATCAFDLGYSETATEHARSAERYARMIGHGGLLAWALGMRALVCYWTPLQRPHESLSLVGKGLAQAPAGTPTLRLRAIQARAHAYIGDSRGAHEAARLAHEQLDAVGHDLIHDEIGGEFSFDGARLARCLGSAYVMLGEAEPAIAEASTALALYAERSPAARMPKVAAEAQIDLAHAYLIQESLDAAIEALRPVFDLGQNQRIEGITGRLAAVRNHLARSTRLRGAREAIALGQEIEAFIAHPAGELVPAIMPSS